MYLSNDDILSMVCPEYRPGFVIYIRPGEMTNEEKAAYEAYTQHRSSCTDCDNAAVIFEDREMHELEKKSVEVEANADLLDQVCPEWKDVFRQFMLSYEDGPNEDNFALHCGECTKCANAVDEFFSRSGEDLIRAAEKTVNQPQ